MNLAIPSETNLDVFVRRSSRAMSDKQDTLNRGPTRTPASPHGKVNGPNAGRLRSRLGHGARGGRTALGRALLALTIVSVLVAPNLAIGTSRADTPPAQAPNFQGAVIVGNGAALAILGYVGWADVWTAVGSNGTQIYSQAFYLNLFDLRPTPSLVYVSVLQHGASVTSANVYVPADAEVGLTLTLPADPAWTRSVFEADNDTIWVGPVATPISFLPSYIANVGGLDLFALVLISFATLIAASGYALAQWAMRRATYAPRFSLLVWGHVFLALIAGLVFLDFQFIDQTFAGWAPLLYPWPLLPMFFLTGLSRFNRAPKVEVQRGVSSNQGEFAVERTVLRAAELPDGRGVFVGESWGQFWARFWGHYPVFYDPKDGVEPPLMLPVLNTGSPTGTALQRRKLAKRQRPAYPIGPTRLFAFRVSNPQTDDVGFIAFARSDHPLARMVVWPRLSWSHAVVLPARTATATRPDGSTETIVTRPERTVMRLTWPHYVDESNYSDFLEDRHYLPAAAVWYLFASTRDLGRVLSKVKGELAMLKAHFDNRLQDELYTELQTFYSLVGRSTSGLSDEEAAALSRDWAGLTGPKGAPP